MRLSGKNTVFFICIIIFFFLSCSNKLDLIDMAPSTPVAYGVVSTTDSIIYIRVERSFADPVKSAQELALIPDSIYYADISVQLIKNANSVFDLTKVDASLEGYPRQDGYFTKAPNYLYKIAGAKIGLKADDLLTLKISRKDGLLAQSTINVVGPYELLDGLPTFNPPYIDVRQNSSLSVGFRSDEKTARFYDVSLYFNYTETSANNTVFRQVKWDFQRSVPRKIVNGQPSPEIIVQKDQSLDLFTFLASVIPVQTGVMRKFQSIDIQVEAGGTELLNYINIGDANTGITASQTPPVYSNLSNGYGLFTSRSALLKKGFMLSDASLELLKSGNLTRGLNFQ